MLLLLFLMKVEPLIKKELEKIWGNPNYKEFCVYPYLYPDELIKDSILFVGINPSFNEEDLKITNYGKNNEENTITYFRKFNDIAKHCNVEWSHLDLLFFRETKQEKIYEIIKSKNGLDFIWEQLKISKQLIQICQPKIIVVCNTLARTFLGKDKRNGQNVWLDFDFKWNEQLGTYLMNETPIFFSGMLSGQRALDLGSYERLKWHIKMVLSKQKI